MKDSKYEEALERARAGKPIDEVFPELKESEDERVRKVIYKLILGMRKEIFTSQDEIVSKDRALAYLERQKEQKPAETSNIDLDTKVNDWVGYMLNDNAQSYSRKNVQILLDNCARFFYDYAVMCLDKPAEWSEEDERMLSDCIEAVGSMSIRSDVKTLRDLLKHLRPQPHWKPSEEQMEALDNARFCKSYNRTELDSLYHDLQKLL